MFYTLYCELCEDKNMTPGGAAAAIGFNRATVTTWKNTGKAPKGDLLTKISKYFEVPVDFLLERPPFDHWPQINADRRGFLAAAGADEDILQMIWGIDALDPYATKMKDFISYVNLTILSAVPKEGGGWDIKERPLSPHKKAPTLTKKDERDIARDLEAIMAELEAGGDMMFDGDPMTPEARESIMSAMRLGLEAAKAKNKERFTPRKYRKE